MDKSDGKTKSHVRMKHPLTLSTTSQWAMEPWVDGNQKSRYCYFSSFSGNWKMVHTFQNSVN